VEGKGWFGRKKAAGNRAHHCTGRPPNECEMTTGGFSREATKLAMSLAWFATVPDGKYVSSECPD
jgi:hypothetical protein